MAVPPGGAMGAAFVTNTDQLKRSWYMFFFQHPLSDIVVPSNDLSFIDMIWADWSPGHPAAQDAENVKNCLRDPANMQAALGYYRATLGQGKRSPEYDAIQAAGGGELTQPTLYLHARLPRETFRHKGVDERLCACRFGGELHGRGELGPRSRTLDEGTHRTPPRLTV